MASQTLLTNRTYEGHLKKAVDVASYYGFTLLPPLGVTPEDRKDASTTGAPEDLIALLRTARAENFIDEESEEPLLIAYTSKIPYKKARRLSLHVLGSHSALAETLLIQAGRSILSEYGIQDSVVHLNSVGGHESARNYRETLKNHYRAHAHLLEAKCRETLKECVEDVHTCNHKGCEEIRLNAPQSLNSLTSASRRHLRNVIERIELLQVPYRLDHSLIGNLAYTTRTVFALKPTDEKEYAISARGERYDALAHTLDGGPFIPAAHLSVEVECPNLKERIKERKRTQTPHAFLVQLGFEAKMHALRVSEDLRRSKIRIEHRLTVDSLSTQLEDARERDVPQIIILGQKEVQDGTVIVRNMKTLDQNVIPLHKLSSYLKRRV